MNQNEKENNKIPGEEEYEKAISLISTGHFKESIPLLSQSANLNYPPSFLKLYSLAVDKNEKQNWELKVEPNFTWYQSKAQDGNPDSLFNLGFCFHYGLGTKKDLKKAAKLYSKAADQGFIIAQCYLGVCYHDGDGVPQDYNKAVELYTKAAEQGFANAQYFLGLCYANGKAVPRDFNKATEFFNKAAKQGLTKAQRIDFSYKNLNVQAIADIFKLHNTLTQISLAGNKFGDLGVQEIAEALKLNNTLTELNIGYNKIGDIGVQAIANALKISNTLTALDIRANSISDAGAQAISEALKVNNTLTELDIGNNKIGDIGVQAIANALKISKSPVKEIELTNTSIENIEQDLRMKKVLLKLDISSNKIERRGINAIAEMLKVNNSLQILDILDFEDIYELADALKYNRSLTTLIIDEDGLIASELKKALQFNICLLHIGQSYDDPFKSIPINRFLKRNKEIQTTLSKRIFECKNTHLSLLDYKILERVNVAVIFKNVWELQQTQQTGKTYEEYLREYWELISNGFSKNFLFILGVCKLNQIPPFRAHLLGIPKEILDYIGSFLNPKDIPIDSKKTHKVLKKESQKTKKQPTNKRKKESESQNDQSKKKRK